MAKKNIEELSYSELLAYVQLNQPEELRKEIKNLKCQLRILQEKYDNVWYENKLQQSTIVKYRRLIEHYEDGAPNYVATQ